MGRQEVGIVIVVIALATCATITALALYPSTVDEPDTSFEPGEELAYEVSGSILLDGETYVAYEGAVSADATAYFSARSEDGTVRKLYEEEGVVYAKLETTDEDEVDAHERIFGGELVSQNTTDGKTTVILRADEPEQRVEDSIHNWNQVVSSNLQLTTYKEVDETSVYEPRDGWFTSTREYRITDANGTLYVDSDTGSLTRATVSFHRTVAGSYLEYLLDRDEAVRYEINFVQRTDSGDVDRPGWVDRESRAE